MQVVRKKEKARREAFPSQRAAEAALPSRVLKSGSGETPSQAAEAALPNGLYIIHRKRPVNTAPLRTAVLTAHQGNVECQTPIPNG